MIKFQSYWISLEVNLKIEKHLELQSSLPLFLLSLAGLTSLGLSSAN